MIQGFLLLLAFGFLPGGHSTHTRAAEVMKCFEGQNCLDQPMSWKAFMRDMPGCLAARHIWWSERADGFPVTLVTQLSVSRLDQLRAQCANWQGPLAAAVYLPLLNPSSQELSKSNIEELQAAKAALDTYFLETERRGDRGCQLRMVLIYQLFAAPRALLLYPINSLRNYARLLADTELITNIDVDMIPSASMSTSLSDPVVRSFYTEGCRRGAVYIWPAFEVRCGPVSYAEEVATAGKAAIREALKHCLKTFRPAAAYLHNATDFKRWLSTDEVYGVNYTNGFEPWFLSSRMETEWYDFRYRGYGNDKMAHCASLNASGTPFLVSPHGFLVHRTHKKTEAYNIFVAAKHKKIKTRSKHAEKRLLRQVKTLNPEQSKEQTPPGSLYERMEALWSIVQAEMQTGAYNPRVEQAFQTCADSLSWWRRPSLNKKPSQKS